jgi:hypothetical protein
VIWFEGLRLQKHLSKQETASVEEQGSRHQEVERNWLPVKDPKGEREEKRTPSVKQRKI